MPNPVELIIKCDEQQAAMQRDIFEFPPADWAAFQNRLGRWQGAQSIKDMLTAIVEDDAKRDDGL